MSFGVVSFDDLFEPVKAVPVGTDKVFGYDSENDVSAAFTLAGIKTFFGGGDWNTMANKPPTFTPSAHSLGSHSNVAPGVDAAADGTFLRKVAGSWSAVAISFLTSETDPVFTASPAGGIENTDISNWDTAFGWGNHAEAGYLTGFTESDPTVGAHIKSITETEKGNWNSAFGWGNHADEGYLTSFTETDPTVGAHIKEISIGQIGTWDAKALEFSAITDNTLLLLKDGIPTESGILATFSENPFDPETEPEDYESWVAELLSFTFPVVAKGVPAVEEDEFVTLGQVSDIFESVDLPIGARKVSAEYLISSDTAGTLVIGKWYNADNVLHEVTGQAIVFAGTPDAGELRWDVMVGKADGTAELITGTAGVSATKPDLPEGSVILFEVIWNEEGGTSAPPEPDLGVWSLDRFNTATIADTTGKYCMIMEMDLGFAMDYAFTLDYGAPATLAANRVGSLHVAFVTTEANIIHGPTVKMTTVGFSDPGDFVLVQLPDNKAALYHHSTNYWMRLQWRVVFQNWAMSLENFKNGEEYGVLPAGTNWSSAVYGDLSEIVSDLTDLENQVQDIETEVDDHETRIDALEEAPTGNLIAGTGVTFSGSGTGRLVGSGDLTVNASGGGGGGSSGLSDMVGFPVIPFNGNYRHSHEMFEPVEISVNTTLARTFPNYSVIYIKADGTNKPTFKASDNFSVVYDGWNNTAGEWNRLRIEWSPQGNPVVQIMACSGAASPGTGATDFALLFDDDYSFSHVIAGTVSLSVDDTGAVYAKKTIFYFMADGTNKPTWSSDIECNFDNYVNEAGVWNRFYLEWTPEDKVTLQIQNT